MTNALAEWARRRDGLVLIDCWDAGRSKLLPELSRRTYLSLMILSLALSAWKVQYGLLSTHAIPSLFTLLDGSGVLSVPFLILAVRWKCSLEYRISKCHLMACQIYTQGEPWQLHSSTAICARDKSLPEVMYFLWENFFAKMITDVFAMMLVSWTIRP